MEAHLEFCLIYEISCEFFFFEIIELFLGIIIYIFVDLIEYLNQNINFKERNLDKKEK